MRRSLALVAVMAAVLVLALAGCSRVTSGTVTGKRYEPPYTTTIVTCMSYSSKGACTFYYPIVSTYPEEYVVQLQHGEDRGSVTVDRETFEELHVGDHYAEPKG